MKFIRNLAALVLLVQFGFYLMPAKRTDAWGSTDTYEQADGQGTLIRCPKGYGYRIPNGERFAGNYISCDDFDLYYEAAYQKDYGRASKFLLIK